MGPYGSLVNIFFRTTQESYVSFSLRSTKCTKDTPHTPCKRICVHSEELASTTTGVEISGELVLKTGTMVVNFAHSHFNGFSFHAFLIV